eukprot:TRINITY_DN57845_c0_g1_i1.p2 TRINITY_DN57845_c0_g1~~TRINITY_DN57845_c0_g1_i1.p2  ORF type:complete len:127 (+),score=50.85 TRINITY_DN57845_c0_g1_i1:84-464(+)
MPAYAAAAHGQRRVGGKRAEHARAKQQGRQVDEEIEQRILSHFDSFDKDKSGKLDCKEMAAVMKLLNDGEDVTQEDVDMVLKRADANLDGQIEKAEFTTAITAWYTACGEEEEEKKKEKSGCCIVS